MKEIRCFPLRTYRSKIRTNPTIATLAGPYTQHRLPPSFLLHHVQLQTSTRLGGAGAQYGLA